jgi:peptidoglycan/LPS O-acetylase OafA/YrhL
MGFRSDIQGLRGLAILLVVAYHAHLSSASGGFVGVDVFFVLSGYLITGLLFKEFDTSGRIKLSEFYARRVRRLLPASAAVLVATVLIARLILSPLEQLNLASSGIVTALYISNLFFIRQSTDYLAAPPEGNPFLHTWSLSVEEQFYLVWPTLVLLLVKMTKSRRAWAAAIGVLAVASFLLNVWLTQFAQPWAFFGSPARVWEFAAGGLLAITRLTFRGVPSLLIELSSGLGLAMIVIAAVTFDRETTFPSIPALLPVVGTMLVLATGQASVRVARLLRNRFMVWLGDLSYVWYLWHWPILVFAAALIPGLDTSGRVLFGVLSLLLSAATRSLLEDKVRFSTWLAARPLTTLTIAVIVTAATVSTSSWWRQSARSDSVSVAQARFSHARDDNPVVYIDGCHLDYFEVTSPECVFGDRNASTTVVLFGDSHAAQWFPALEQVAITEGYRLVSLTKSGCPSVDVVVRSPGLGRRYTECETWRQNVFAMLGELKPNLVLLANASDYVDSAPLGASNENVDTLSNQSSIARTSSDWLAGLQRTLQVFRHHGVPAVIVRDSPRPGFDAPTCLSRLVWQPRLYGNCQFPRSMAVRLDIAKAEDLAASAGLATVVDISSSICNRDTCDTQRGELVMYRDHHHLTARFSATLASPLAAHIRRVVTGTLDH